MSTDYYLNCKTCGEAVNITDNKCNPPIDKEAVRMFLVYHGNDKCHVVLESEHIINYDHVKNFAECLLKYNEGEESHEKSI